MKKRIKTITSMTLVLIIRSLHTLPTKNRDSKQVTRYFAGMIWEMPRIISGILEISKTNPDSINAGRNDTTMEIWEAKNWFLVLADIIRPVPRAVNKNMADTMSKGKMEPLNGTPNKNMEMIEQISIDVMPKIK